MKNIFELDFCALLVNEIHFIVDFYHGVHQPVGDLQVPQDIQNVHFLIHCLRMTDVPHVDQQILKNKESTESKNCTQMGRLGRVTLGYTPSV